MEALLIFLLIVAVCLVVVQAFSSEAKSPVRTKNNTSYRKTQEKQTGEVPSSSPYSHQTGSKEVPEKNGATSTVKEAEAQKEIHKADIKQNSPNFSAKIAAAQRLPHSTQNTIPDKEAEARLFDLLEDVPSYKIPKDDSWRDKSIEFIRTNNLKGFKYHALYDYYPKNRFSDVPLEVANIRKLVYRFKDGLNSSYTATSIASAIYNNCKPDEFGWSYSHTIFAVIPASTISKNNNRFKSFCAKVSDYLQIGNGFDAISIVSDRDAMKGMVGGDKTKNLSYDPEVFRGKRVLLFDDIKTTGGSFIQNATKLKELGAREVEGIFLGETYDTFSKGAPYWLKSSGSSIEGTTTSFKDEGADDDLPF